MRLVCPNCDATYEVPDSVIPSEGRDVQCSNCGKAWFFDPNGSSEPQVEEADDTPPPAPPLQDSAPPTSPTPPTATAPRTAENPTEAQQPEAAAKVQADIERPVPRRRPLDESVTDVLREEAAFEARARAEDAGLEFQDDLPLEEPPESPGRDPLVEAEVTATDAAASSRRDLLPDIDETNSTLRAASERASPEVTAATVAQVISKRRQGFRTGFGLALIVLALFTFAYTTAETISDRAPSVAPMLDNYVSMVNAGRGWLEGAVEGLVRRMGA